MVPHTCSPLLAYGQKLLSSLKITERQSILQSTLSRHRSSRTWRCLGESGSLTRGTRDLSPAASKWFPMVRDDTAGATCARISFLDAVRAATAASIMSRSCACTTRQSRIWSTGLGIFHRSLLKATAQHRYIVPNM